MFVGRDETIVTRDLRTLLNLELREECSRTLGRAWAGIQQAQSENFGFGHGLESSKRNRGAAVEADVIGEQQLTIGEQQLTIGE